MDICPGRSCEIRFSKWFDFPCKAFLTPCAKIRLKESYLHRNKMLVLSSVWENEREVPATAKFSWAVYGLIDLDLLPTWYIHFYGAITQLEHGLFKPALIDYAVAFEVFLDTFLTARLTKRCGTEVARYLLRRAPRIEERVKDLLELAIGSRLSSRDDVYQPWDKDVRTLRNKLAHGERLTVDRDAVERAHSAVYQAIRWIQDQEAAKVEKDS